MKIYTTLFFLLFLVCEINLFPQIPNSGFENWGGGDPFTPEGWLTTNAAPAFTPISLTTVAYMGSYAVQLWIINSIIGPIPPHLVTSPFPVSEAYGSMMGYYQFYQNTSTEVLFIQTWFMNNGQLVGGGLIDIGTPTSTYTQFSFNIEYSSRSFNVVPDSAYISITVVDTSSNPPVAGAYAYIDGLSFGPARKDKKISSTISENISTISENFEMKQNYPNPFNPSTKIEYTIPEASFVQLKIYNALGNEVAELVNEEQLAGTYKAEFSGNDLASGLYIAQLRAGEYSKTITMTLIR